MDLISGRSKGFLPSAARAVLWAMSGPYFLAMRLRRWACRRGCFRSRQPAAPVISVGNLTTGGAGKTPMVAWVVGHLQQAGFRPAVLTRGYMASGGVSDEASLLSRLCHPAPVVVNPDRWAGAQQALRTGADVLVMDDGFQRLRLRRQLDIVMVDASEPFGFGHVLPRGLLREPLSALQDADAVVLTRTDAVSAARLEQVLDVLRKHTRGATFHSAVHRPSRIVDQDGREHDVNSLAGRRVLAFCGLGNPDAFFDTLRRLGADLAGEVAFEDHARYDAARLAKLARQARACGAELLATTAKDRVKLPGVDQAFAPAGLPPLPLWTLEIALEFVEGGQALLDCILSVRLGSLQSASR
jgi:tetraacyldisaccharide 4'-kinase